MSPQHHYKYVLKVVPKETINYNKERFIGKQIAEIFPEYIKVIPNCFNIWNKHFIYCVIKCNTIITFAGYTTNALLISIDMFTFINMMLNKY